MKGHFSVEWLSQSSQSSASSPSSPGAASRSSSYISMASDRASTSGTVPETLPGFYSRRVDSMNTQQVQSEPMGPAQSFITAPKKEPAARNTESLQNGKILNKYIYINIYIYSKTARHVIKCKYVLLLNTYKHYFDIIIHPN